MGQKKSLLIPILVADRWKISRRISAHWIKADRSSGLAFAHVVTDFFCPATPLEVLASREDILEKSMKSVMTAAILGAFYWGAGQLGFSVGDDLGDRITDRLNERAAMIDEYSR
ncbi:hypothetical protein [Allochromatium tepidum]|uniref:hypothetical protein n=1 Tax=Allochromatium tepidum TaxID=553982 RepID=UPI001BCE9659|nr:hypothetical protein [Allochromatium tepidum]